MRAVTTLLVLSLSGAALAQEELPTSPSAREQVAGVLAEAGSAGALERLLKEQAFRVEQDGVRLVIRRRARLVEDGQVIACRVDLAVVGGPSKGVELRLASEIELDTARLRRSRFVTLLPAREGQSRAEAEGTLSEAGDVLAMTVTEPDGTSQEVEIPWGDDVLPWSLLFFLPSLQDQGLPDRMIVRIYDETRLQLGEPTVVTCARDEDDDEVDVLSCEVRPAAEPGKLFRARALAEGADAGRLRSVHMRKWKSLEPIAVEEAEKLLAEAGLGGE
jgi:hypothetical protein